MEEIRHRQSNRAKVRLIVAIAPIVIVLMLVFFTVNREELLALSQERLALATDNCATALDVWTGTIVSELEIYRRSLQTIGFQDGRALELIAQSSGRNDAYPFGIYWGDAGGAFLDGSGWVPPADYRPSEQTWFQEGTRHESVMFGDPYHDAMTHEICISVTAMMKCTRPVSVLSADVYLANASKLVSEVAQGNVSDAFLVSSRSRMVIAHASDPELVGRYLNESSILLDQNINELMNQREAGRFEVQGLDGLYYVDISPVANTDWYLICSVSRNDMLKGLYRMQGIMLTLAFLAAGAIVVVTAQVTKGIKEIRTSANTDPLTRLLNRDGFYEKVSDAMREHPGQGLLLICDLDNFKRINDQYGHPRGDLVLQTFADLLTEFFNRQGDVVSRMGGDEFAVFVGRELSRQDAEVMLGHLIAQTRKTFAEYESQALCVSAGVAFTSEDGGYDALYAVADQALYEAKRGGKSGFRVAAETGE